VFVNVREIGIEFVASACLIGLEQRRAVGIDLNPDDFAVRGGSTAHSRRKPCAAIFFIGKRDASRGINVEK
jgi:hypothetical protein